MCDCKLPFKVFSDEFIRGLYVKSVEDMIDTYKAQDEAMKSGKPVMLFTETNPANSRRQHSSRSSSKTPTRSRRSNARKRWNSM